MNLPSEPLLRQTAELLRSGAVKRIVVLVGAGISVAANIPDFRSKGGMYDTLKPELFTATDEQRQQMMDDPTQVVNRKMFAANQFLYLECRRPFIIGTAECKWLPTISHAFFTLLHKKGLLLRVYTQNIDGLDYMMDLPEEKLVSVHGTITKVACEFCGAPGPENGSIKAFAELVKKNIRNIYDPNDETAPKESTNIRCAKCELNGLKPATVMYGGAMPPEFFEKSVEDLSNDPKDADKVADCMIVAGTSLTVFPAAFLPSRMPAGKPIIVCNRDPVDCKSYTFLQGNLDEQFLRLIDLCGWMKDLEELAFGEKNRMCEGSQELIKKYSAARQKQIEEMKQDL